jgi:hypothetical protein
MLKGIEKAAMSNREKAKAVEADYWQNQVADTLDYPL